MTERWQEPFTEAEMRATRMALRDEESVLRDAFARLRELARRLPFAEDALTAYFCVRDPSTPARVRFTLLAALAYFVLPFDAVPDLIPLLGFGDDAAVIAAAIAAVRSALAPHHREQARAVLNGEEPTRR